MVEPYDLTEIDNFATIEEFSEPLIDKYSQSFTNNKSFGFNFLTKTDFYPIFISFNGHIKYFGTIHNIDNELKQQLEIQGYCEISIDKINNQFDNELNIYIDFYKVSNIIPNKIIIGKPISFNLEDFFSEYLNENMFIRNDINIYNLIEDCSHIQKTKLINKNNNSKLIKTNEISNAIIFNKEFKYTFIFNKENFENRKINIGNTIEFEVIYSQENIIDNSILDSLYNRKFWNNFLVNEHSLILTEIVKTEEELLIFKNNLSTIINNIFITKNEITINKFSNYSLNDIYLKIKDRLNKDYGLSVFYIMSKIEEILIEFRQEDGTYSGIIDRYNYQINNNLEVDYEERSKLYNK
jgi:hypothetical protein